MSDSVGKSVYEKEIWNKAIETAASLLEADPVTKPQAIAVRGLKK